MSLFRRAANNHRSVHRWFGLWPVVAALLLTGVGASPATAKDCGECDLGCHLASDAFALVEEYLASAQPFAGRAQRCSESDDRWKEVLDRLEELNQKPPDDGNRLRRHVSKLELAAINHELGIRACMLHCGREEYVEECHGGPGGMFCNCKDGASAYCRNGANQSIAEVISPGFAGGGSAGPSTPTDDATQWDAEDSDVPEPEVLEEDPDEPRYLIEISVTAKGFELGSATAPCDFEPSAINVAGRVLDEQRVPVAGARVTLVGLGATMLTDARGFYNLVVPTEGGTPFNAVRDIVIVRQIRELAATVVPTTTVWANGRGYEASLTVTSKGLPVAGKEVIVTDWKGFSRNGQQVSYLQSGRGNHASLKLDDQGRARFRFTAPVLSAAQRTAADPASLFPVSGHFRVKLRDQQAATECDYRIDSPFPRVSRIRIPGNVDAGLWQVQPSSIVIDDPDSSSFRVTLRGIGDFRTTQPMAAIKKGLLTHELDGKTFEFLYRPRKQGLDPTALPDELDQFMNTNMNIYISVATNVVGGMAIDQLQAVKPNGMLGKIITKPFGSMDANDLLDFGSNFFNIVNTTNSAIELHGTDSNNPEQIIINTGNYLIGVVDTSMGLAGTLNDPRSKLKWEAAKAYWEYLKLINSIQNQYEELASAYQDTLLYPIEVTLEDESGHRTRFSRACSVRVWKGGSE